MATAVELDLEITLICNISTSLVVSEFIYTTPKQFRRF